MKRTVSAIQPVAIHQVKITRRKKMWLHQFGVQSLFLLPAFVIFTTFVIYPTLSSFYYSLTDWNGLDPSPHFVGLVNFQQLLHDASVLADLRNTLVFAVSVVILQNSIALALAVILDTLLRRFAFLRVLFLIPALLSSLAIGYIWSYIYGPIFGFLNVLLGKLGLAAWQQDWLGDPRLALGSVIVTNTWQWVGFSMVIFLAGLQAVPVEMYDAASIDGATRWQRFHRITLPLIAPAVTVNVILTLIGSLKIFDLIFVMTSGGPAGASESLALRVYKEAFTLNQFGYATAIGIAMSLLILIFSLVNLRILRKREVEF